MSEANTLWEFVGAFDAAMRLAPGVVRDEALSNIMTRMERQYQIPMLAHPAWNEKHRLVMDLYRKIAKSRTTI
ncbi:hypothetical protein [Alicyclobacillus sp. ALC3]|uniref:hypothetical protein n=1 Tax=Alicyclobacillus sp. ALC3 TaxID=2796143 RepID=UPI0023784C0E|nr:hypothetical protein [Alicyclobacillus sp. ALC3]WDL98158.1 hypothetical protein JC200_05505 [Alicyclobacillus sp. ALC3]